MGTSVRPSHWLAAPIRLIYFCLFATTLTVMGGRATRSAAGGRAREAVDDAMSADGSPLARVDVTNLGTLAPMAIGLTIALPGLLLYPLYESERVLSALLVFVMICVAFSLTQLLHFLFALWERRRWTTLGRPGEWLSSRLARPNALDTPIWGSLSVLLVIATS